MGYIVVGLDIDGVLIDYDKSVESLKSNKTLVWRIPPETLTAMLDHIKKTAEEQGNQVIFAVVTAKKKPDPFCIGVMMILESYLSKVMFFGDPQLLDFSPTDSDDHERPCWIVNQQAFDQKDTRFGQLVYINKETFYSRELRATHIIPTFL